MSDFNVKPYEGNGSFVFISYHPDEFNQVKNVISCLSSKGVRLWYDAGIQAGMEKDEILAEHIESCEYFVAFVSKKYMEELDCTDEVNYARDLAKTHLLVYLEDVELSAGMKMRFERTQSLQKFSFNSEDAFVDKLMDSEVMQECFGVADKQLHQKALKLFDKLESYYPEHKIFGLEGLDRDLYKKISEFYKDTEFKNAEELCKSYGYFYATPQEVKQIRSEVIYRPGNEPEIIKNSIELMKNRLAELYPNRIIDGSLGTEYKHVFERISALYRWLGYETIHDMLKAYGYDYIVTTGRDKRDFEPLFKALVQKYDGIEKPTSMSVLIHDNEEYASALKTLSNRSKEMYGKSASDYLLELGILSQKETINIVEERQNQRIEAFISNEQFGYLNKSDNEKATLFDLLKQLNIKINSKFQFYIKKVENCADELVIPKGISFISSDAFSNQTQLRSLTIPSTLFEIGSHAFANCTSLEAIEFSEGLEFIEEGAFEGCINLKSVVLPESLRVIEFDAFKGCESLEEVVFKNPMTSVYEDAFDGCSFDINTLDESHTTDPDDFEFDVDRKNNAKITGYYGSDEYVCVPSSIQGHPVIAIDKGAFEDNEDIVELSMADTVTSLGADAFKNCVNLRELHLSNNINKLMPNCFAGCTALENVNIPNATVDLKRGTFKESPLISIHIGKSLKKLDLNAFFKGEYDPITGEIIKARTIQEITVDPENEHFVAEGSCILSKDKKVLCIEFGENEECEIPEGIEEISASAFAKLSGMKKLFLPDSLIKIGEKAFADSGLEEITFGAGLKEIGVQAFSYCRSLKKADLPSGIEIIDDQAFEGCPVERVNIPATVTKLGADCFMSLSNFKGETEQVITVDENNSVFKADDFAIYQITDDGITLLKAYKFDLGLQVEDSNASLEYEIKDGTTHIADYAFARSHNLKSVKLPDSLKSIGMFAFWDCKNLEINSFDSSQYEIGSNAFLGTKISL